MTFRWAAAATAVVTTAGCAWGGSGGGGRAAGPAGGDGYLSAREAAQEYRSEAEEWTLAPGWEWPEEPGIPAADEHGAPIRYEEGFGRVKAGNHWFCSWTWFLTREAEGEEEREEALDELRKARRSYRYTDGLSPAAVDVTDRALAAADSGDDTALSDFAGQNCSDGALS